MTRTIEYIVLTLICGSLAIAGSMMVGNWIDGAFKGAALQIEGARK